VLLNEE
jgi:hypothetical protein